VLRRDRKRRGNMDRQQVIDFIQDVHFGFLATLGEDDAPRVRPVGIKDVYGDAIYFFTFANTRKCAEIAHCPQVEVVWAKLPELSQVRIRGQISVETDEAVTEQFKADNPIVSRMLPPGAEHLFCLYRLDPERVEVAEGLVPYTAVEW